MAAQGKSTERMQIIESMIIRATRAIVSHPLVEDIFVLTLETKDIVRVQLLLLTQISEVGQGLKSHQGWKEV